MDKDERQTKMTRTLSTASKYTTLGLLATLAAAAASPVLADPASQQKNKNQWRNLGIAGAAIAGYGLLNHNTTATVLGAAGAAYSANRYEHDRQSQSQNSSNRYDYRHYHRNDNNGGGYYNKNGSYDNNGGQWRNDYNSNDYNSNNGYDNRGNDDNQHQNNDHHDNGRHRGWAKHHNRKDDNDRD